MGIVLFELFTGTRPFTADSAMAVIYKHVHEEPSLDSPAAQSIPTPVKPIIQKVLAKNRDDRYATATELRRELLRARASLATTVAGTTDTIVSRVKQLRGSPDAGGHQPSDAAKSAPRAAATPARPRKMTRRGLWQLLTAASVLVLAVTASSLLTLRAPRNQTDASPPVAESRTSAPTQPAAPPALDPPKSAGPAPTADRPTDTRATASQTAAGTPTAASLVASCTRGDAEACRVACDAKVAAACTQLGVLHNRGTGTARDLAVAALYYQRGCDGGDPAGCNNLGTIYQFGALGLAADRARAAALYERACHAGHLEACANLGSLYLEDPAASTQQKARARTLLKQACDAGISRACARLGV